jgi:predicted DNA-binding transcriptional regulator YafY
MKEITQNLGKEFEDSFKALYNKVLGVEEESPYYIKIPDGFKLDKEYPFINDMKEAIEYSKKIYLCYLNKEIKKCFELDPLKLIFFNGCWYLLCRVEHKDSIIKLRLDNISDVKVLNKHFVYEDNLKQVLDDSTNVWFQEKRDIVVKMRVDAKVAPYFKKKKYFPVQKILKKHTDGSLTIESKIAYQMEVIPDVLKWIPFVLVLSPKFIKDEIEQRINKYMKK